MLVHKVGLLVEQLDEKRLDKTQHLGTTTLELAQVFLALTVRSVLLEELDAVSEFGQCLLQHVLVHFAARNLAGVVEVVLAVVGVVVQALLHLHRQVYHFLLLVHDLRGRPLHALQQLDQPILVLHQL